MTTIRHAAVALVRAVNIGFRTGFSQRDMRDNLGAPLVFAEQTFQQFGRASFRRGKQASQRQPSRRARYHLSWRRQLGPWPRGSALNLTTGLGVRHFEALRPVAALSTGNWFLCTY